MIQEIESHGFKVYGNLVMINGDLYPLPLVEGNTKLGKKVYHASTLPTKKEFTITLKNGETITEKGTCPTTCNGCYGTEGRYKCSSTLFWIAKRTELLRRYPDAYFLLMAIQIKHENVEKLRIHATGDFITGEASGYINVLKQFPDLKAWTYTKCKVVGEIAELNALPNCNVVKSIIPGHGFNFGTVAYIANMYYLLKRRNKSVYICRCGIDPNQHCSDCNGCSDHEYVLFIEHSTGYNAKTDYGYDKMVELIENQ